MKLSIKALALAMGLVWGGAVLVVGTCFVYSGNYGRAFLEMCASLYPGFHVTQSFASVIVGTLYGLVDGAIGGAIFAWVYNCFAKE